MLIWEKQLACRHPLNESYQQFDTSAFAMLVQKIIAYASATLFIAEAAARTTPFDKYPDWCESWTFNNSTPPECERCPEESDCEELIEYLESTPRIYWTVLPREPGTKKRYCLLESMGTCAFGARLTGGNGQVKLGRMDMLNIVKKSLRDYAQDGHLSAWGKGVCQGKEIFMNNEISWIIVRRDIYLFTIMGMPIWEKPEKDW